MNCQGNELMIRTFGFLKLIVFGGIMAIALYFFLCIYSLESMAGSDLVAMRMLPYDSGAEPVGMPMPGAAKNLYWEARGRKKILELAKKDSGMYRFARDIAEHSESLGYPLDHDRSRELLADLERSKSKD